MLAEITWPVAFAIVGSILTIVGGIIKLFKTNNEDKADAYSHSLTYTDSDIDDELDELRIHMQGTKSKIDTFAVQIENLKKNDSDLKDDMLRNSRDCVESFNKLEKKLEKVTDLMIELIKTHNN